MSFGLASTLYGLAAALTWGAGDFSGGVATKRSSVYSVVVTAHFLSLTLLLSVVAIYREPVPPREAWIWGGLAGLGGGIGLLLLYRGLASGKMALVAPVSALVAAALPVIVTSMTGGIPNISGLAGFAFALGAIWLLSGGGSIKISKSELSLPFGAGLAFGLFFICLHKASLSTILYPLIAVRLVSIPSILLFAVIKREPIIPKLDSLTPILMSGLLDTLGNGAFALSAQTGHVEIAAILGSLYPGSTVLLAWILLKEHINSKQLVGLMFALMAIVLITI